MHLFARLGGRAAVLTLIAPLLMATLVSSSSGAQTPGCDPGAKELTRLVFRGNHAFSSDELADRVSTTPSSWARRHLRIVGTRRCLDHAQLVLDVYRLKLLYHNAGYYSTAIDTAVTPLGRDAVGVTFTIREGPPIIVRSASISGLDSVPNRKSIEGGLDLGIGKPFDLTRFYAVADTLNERLRNDGYPHVVVLQHHSEETDSLIARWELTVLPGVRAKFGDILIHVQPRDRTTQQIPDAVVRRLLGVHPGAQYSDESIVDARRNLFQTGAYRHLDVRPVTDTLPQRADSLVNLDVTLIEDYMRQLDTEAGWATLDCFRTQAQYTDKNFLNGARRLQVTGQVSKIGFGDPLETSATRKFCYGDLVNDPFSQVINYHVGANLTEPLFFGTNVVPALSLYRERRGEYLAYLRTTLIGGDASLTKNLGRLETPLRLGYTLEFGRTEAPDAVLCAVFARCDSASVAQTKRNLPLAIASAALTRVRTDSPLDPTRGDIIRAEVRTSSELIGSDPQLVFNKGVLDGTWFHVLGWQNVLAVRLRGGLIVGGIGSQQGGAALPPPQERLYAGGATSVRGFQQNELGNLVYLAGVGDTTITKASGQGDSVYYIRTRGGYQRVVPVGGNALVVGNLEYRLRSILFPQALQYTLFTDVGQLWTRGAGSGGAGGAAQFSVQQLKWTPGVGVRYFSPVGPIQANVGYNPYPQPPGPVYFSGSPDQLGHAPLYCVTPGNTVKVFLRSAALPNGQTIPELVPDATASCPSDFAPQQHNTLLSRLTFTISIGPAF